MHGEMPDWFAPPVWWVSLGMNDIGRMQCSEEVVVMGILRVVEELMEKRQNAQIVLNSMLPMADLRGGIYPHAQDYQDAFQGNSKQSRIVKNEPKDNGATRALRKKNTEDEIEQYEGEDPKNPMDKKEKKRYRKRKDPVNPLLDPNKTKMKKYQLFKKNLLPLWTSIYAINRELRKFCEKHDRVTFFDATNIFAERVERGKYMLRSDMISIRGHPTVAGYSAWEAAMLKKLQSMLANEEKEKKVVKYNVEESISSNKSDDGSMEQLSLDKESSGSKESSNDPEVEGDADESKSNEELSESDSKEEGDNEE